MTSKTEKVYILDDDIDLCKALRWLLESIDLKVETFSNPVVFLEALRPDWQGCLLLDIRMPEMSGLQVQEDLMARGNLLPIIMLSGHGDITIAAKAMKAGALDFITKPFNENALLEQVQKAMKITESHTSKQEIIKRYRGLTPREKEVLTHIVAGKMNKVIAYELDISLKTVEVHRANLMQKMRAKSFAELIKMSLLVPMEILISI